MTSEISELDKPASCIACSHGAAVLSIKSSTNDSNFERVIFTTKCFGPDASAVMYGKFTSVCELLDSSIFAFSAASLRRCFASISWVKSTPFSFLNSSAR